MRTTIYYFTGTGNSLMVARDLAKELDDTKIVSIAKAMNEPEIDVSEDVIGFVFPLYYQVMPVIVQDFIEKLTLHGSKYIFAVVTSGSFVGHALDQISNLLSERGTELDAGYQLILPNNFIINPFGMNVPDQSKQEKLFQKEKEKVKEIVENIKGRITIGIEKKPFILMRYIHPRSLNKKARFTSKLQDDAKKFWVNEQCRSCSICKLVCPVNNIELVDNKPIWLDHCQQCLACIHWCTEAAIQFSSNRTINKNRYTNPTITVKDMINSACLMK